jgi:hypothetical protein
MSPEALLSLTHGLPHLSSLVLRTHDPCDLQALSALLQKPSLTSLSLPCFHDMLGEQAFPAVSLAPSIHTLELYHDVLDTSYALTLEEVRIHCQGDEEARERARII